MARDFTWTEMDSWRLEAPKLGQPIDPDTVVSISAAQAKVETLLDRLASEGFDVQGWADGTITLDTDLDNAVIQPRRALHKLS